MDNIYSFILLYINSTVITRSLRSSFIVALKGLTHLLKKFGMWTILTHWVLYKCQKIHPTFETPLKMLLKFKSSCYEGHPKCHWLQIEGGHFCHWLHIEGRHFCHRLHIEGRGKRHWLHIKGRRWCHFLLVEPVTEMASLNLEPVTLRTSLVARAIEFRKHF